MHDGCTATENRPAHTDGGHTARVVAIDCPADGDYGWHCTCGRRGWGAKTATLADQGARTHVAVAARLAKQADRRR